MMGGSPANRRLLLGYWFFSSAEGIGNRKPIRKRQQVSDVTRIRTISDVVKGNSAVENGSLTTWSTTQS
jgi:hypothetical protein